MMSATCQSSPVQRILREYQDQNVGETERWMSLVGGAFLAAHGLTRGSVFGLAIAAVGAGLLLRGSTGHCPLYESLDRNTAESQ